MGRATYPEVVKLHIICVQVEAGTTIRASLLRTGIIFLTPLKYLTRLPTFKSCLYVLNSGKLAVLEKL